jgi:hypothetical protein
LHKLGSKSSADGGVREAYGTLSDKYQLLTFCRLAILDNLEEARQLIALWRMRPKKCNQKEGR